MADRNRRKSSILKLPKSNARAPLQDVNTLEVKTTLDDDLTSHTALARRRVSFAGKNFVKEFCSEADIVSVYHAPEYEELLASAESSGLVTSDSSNTHSSTTISENNSTFGSRAQLSASKSVSIQDDYDPCDEIMLQFKGKKGPQTQAQKPSGKTRLSFGDICIPKFESEDAPPPAVETSTRNIKTCSSHKKADAQENYLMAGTKTSNPILGAHLCVRSKVFNLLLKLSIIVSKSTKLSIKDRTELRSVLIGSGEERKPEVKRFLFEGGVAQSEYEDTSPSLVGSSVPTPTMENSVFVSQTNLAHSASEAPKIGIEHMNNVDCGLGDTTQCMNESMDFTKAVPGVIHIGCLENPVADDNKIQLEPIRQSLPHSKTQIMCTSMEFTQALPGNIQTDFQHGNNPFPDKRENEIRYSNKAKSTATKPSGPVPSEIQVGFPIDRITGVLQTEKEAVNQTIAMDSSMEMTKPLPSNIQVGFASNDIGILPKEGGMANCTTAMHTSMEMTRPLPSNIQVGLASNDMAGFLHKDGGVANCTVAMHTSMEMTRPLPSNIQVGLAANDMAGIPYKEIGMVNHTIAMDTSMEMTKPLPTNIQVGLASNNMAGILHKEGVMANCTTAMHTSMEMTRPLPSNIQVGLTSNNVAGILHKEGGMVNCTTAIHTSMEMTKPLPSNIQVGLASNDMAGILHKEGGMANCTTAMHTSMEMTKPLPSNIQVGLAANDMSGIPNKEIGMANDTIAMDTSMEMTKPLPSNIQIGLASNNVARIPHKQSGMANHTVAMDTSMEMTKPLPSNIQVGFVSNDLAGITFNEDGVAKPSTSFKEEFDKDQKVQSNFLQGSVTIHSSDAHELPMGHPSFEIEDSFVLPADPFKSKPLLNSSPPRQSGIEAYQSLSKKVAVSSQVGVEHTQSGMGLSSMSDIISPVPNELQEKPLSNTRIGADPFKSKVISILPHSVQAAVEEVRSLEVPLRTTANTELSPRTKSHFSVSKSPNSIALKAVSGSPIASTKTEHPTPFLDVSNPFKSKSRLMNSPIKHSNELSVHVSPSNKEADGPNSEVRNDGAMQPTTATLLGDMSSHHLMISDEPDPFQDVPSVNMEISASINDSGANLLHTTIKNAELTLQQMHSPDLEEMQPISRNKENSYLVKALEDMDCDPFPSEGASSALLPSNEANSCLSHQIASPEDEGSINKKSTRDDTDKIEGIQTAKRSRDHSLDCRGVDPNTSDESSSSKRLCKYRPVAVSKECKETFNGTFGSDLSEKMSSSSSSNQNCSNTSSDEHFRSVDDIVSNPKLWIAMKKGEDLWSFSFTHMCFELEVHLKMSSTAEGIVEGSHGRFLWNVSDSTKPIIRWGMKILMDKLDTKEWDSLLYHSPNFLNTMQKLRSTVIDIKSFLAEAIAQEGLLNLEYTPNSFSTLIMSFKLHLCFQVTVELDLLERFTPDHITVLNIFGKVREQEVKNLVTGVKKDKFFVRNYIRDIKDYVVTLESFCK
ncbi:LOW QUALITY PROTEIN: uncharacterized protein LOC117651002 [Thrips palmi]|uniref:LOW QUALITY PROTEIN: uncharacterized protein LOC117651002 n=1 Tax=Thrips palmi TaxID=161013 RepID=A0A6P8ZZQ8_THRPL|nr:LOW QUALITY PROTEIN: uncharacterized protein LOC117651002 [Thrips palmi]